MKKILLSCVTCLLALGLVTACNDEVEEVPEEPEVPGTVVDEGETTYLFGFEVDGTMQYIDGGLVEFNGAPQSYEGSVTDDVSKAVAISYEVSGSAYYLSFENEGVTNWITIISGEHTNLSYATTKSPIYLHTTDGGAEYFGNEDGSYFLCYNSAYKCLYASSITGTPSSSNVPYIQSSPVAGIYTTEGKLVAGGVGEEAPEPYVPTKPEVTEDYEYFFGFPTEGTAITGSVVGNYDYEGEITSDANEMVLVKLEEATAEGDEGGYYISFKLGEKVSYITIEVIEEEVYDDEDENHEGDPIDTKTYYDLAYAEEAAPLYWNETYGCWGTEDGNYFLCCNTTYGCLYCSNISWVSSSPIAECFAPSEVSEVTISGPTSILIGEGDITLTATANAFAPLTDVNWSSSNAEIATVTDGVVAGVAEGEVTITATASNGVSGTYAVTVYSPVASELYGTYKIENANQKASGTELTTTTLTTLLKASWSSADESENVDPLESVTSCSKIYLGNTTTGGWKQDKKDSTTQEYPTGTFLKTGASNTNGTMDLEFSVEVAKVVISCHTWNATNASTPSYDTVAVNGFAAKQASMDPNNYGDLEFNLFPSNEVSIVTADRVFIASIAIYVPTAAD